MYSYVQVISEAFPNVVYWASGDEYADINWMAGDPIPTQAELDAAKVILIKQKIWLQIQDERTRRQAGGVFVASVNKWFHSDQTSRIQQLGLVMMGASMPPNINWKTMDGSFVIMTPSLAVSIFNAAAVLDMTAFGVAEYHRTNVNASSTPETYDFTTSWPAIFTG